MKPNLEQYFKDNYTKGIIDHAIRVSHIDNSGKPHFYIHAVNHNSDTLDFVVNENWITQKFTGSKKVRVNGIEVVIDVEAISYEELATLAGLQEGYMYSAVWTMRNHTGGTIIPGQVVRVQDGMNFNIGRTDNA